MIDMMSNVGRCLHPRAPIARKIPVFRVDMTKMEQTLDEARR